MELSSYEKQMRWRKAQQKKAERLREDSHRQNDHLKFEPTLYSHPVREFDGPAREISDRSSKRHVERQNKARVEKALLEVGDPHRNVSAVSGSSSILSDERNSISSFPNSNQADSSWLGPPQPAREAVYNSPPPSHSQQQQQYQQQLQQMQQQQMQQHQQLQQQQLQQQQHLQQQYQQPLPLPPLPSVSDSIPQNAHQFDYLDVSSTSSSEEPIIEQLERERRQWQSERERLIQCIHLQQLELSQRALAAQERALEIAQDFARLIETFEDRLVTVETNVQKEISSLKVITANLLQATGRSANFNDPSTAE